MLLEEEHFDRHGVPIPAKYQAPSKDQLTRAVTEEMVTKKQCHSFLNIG